MSQLPRISDLMVAPTQALLDARPTARKTAYVGRYADVLRGWEAQATRFRRYLAEECRAAKLRFAEDQELVELAASEFWAQVDLSPRKAIGGVVLIRSGSLPQGTIRKGHRFARKASSASPQWTAALYQAASPVFVKAGQTVVEVPLEAAVSGEAANQPRFPDEIEAEVSSVDALFDPALAPGLLTVAGGFSTVDNEWLRDIARAAVAGQFGPLDSALRAGAFTSMQVRRVASILDSVNARAKLFVADASWATSPRQRDSVKQTLRDSWLGFGGAVDVLPIYNTRINISADVTLAGPQYIDDTSGIVAAITTELKKYFDERPDFYTFDNYALRGLISRADSRIMTCASVTVKDAGGATLTASELTGNSTFAPHYMLADDAVDFTFGLPS